MTKKLTKNDQSDQKIVEKGDNSPKISNF